MSYINTKSTTPPSENSIDSEASDIIRAKEQHRIWGIVQIEGYKGVVSHTLWVMSVILSANIHAVPIRLHAPQRTLHSQFV